MSTSNALDLAEKPKSKPKHTFKARRKRRHSNNSNASIISIDPVSLKSLRTFSEKVAKENKKQKHLYRQQKKSHFEDVSKKFIANELKEEDEYKSHNNPSKDKLTKPNTKTYYSDESNTPKSPYASSGGSAMEDITVQELLPLIKNLVDRHNKLQTEYDALDRALREQKIVMGDKITQLEQQMDFEYDDTQYFENQQEMEPNDSHRKSAHSAGMAKVRQEYEDKIGILKNNYENNLLSIQSGYEQDLEKQKKEIKTLNTELNGADKEIDALRQSLEALEHENQSLRLSINNNNKQFANVKLIKNRNKQLTTENETLHLQIEGLEQGIEILMAEQEQIERENDDSLYLNSHNAGTKQNPNQRPQTPSHGYTKTVMMGNRDQLELNPAKSNSAHAVNLSDHESSLGGNDLLNQIQDLNNDYVSAHNHSSDLPDRDSNYEDYEEEDFDEKKTDDQMPRDTILENLSKYKRNIGAVDPASMQQILALLQKKENKRLGNHSQPSQDVLDNYSVESNYSDSNQEMKEQIDNIEDDIREVKDMILSLMDSTNNVTPTINASLGPLVRKINRMYLMMSGPAQSRTDEFGNDGSVQPREIVEMDRFSDVSSNRMGSDNKSNVGVRRGWYALMAPAINDWMPSIGFSAIILSTMYLLLKYHKGSFIGIGQPRVLRNKRGKL